MKPQKIKLIQLLLTLLIVIGTSNRAKAQKYFPLITDSAEWNYIHVESMGSGSTSYSPYNISLAKDTIYQGLSYKIDSHSKSIIREDTIQKQVFARIWYQDTLGAFQFSDEVLLYDFGLALGDTFQIASFEIFFDTLYFSVVQLDSITDLDSNHRKRIGLNLINHKGIPKTMTWIEGIGAIDLDLIYPSGSSFADWHTSNTLFCFKQYSYFKFENPYPVWSIPVFYYDCSFVTGIPVVAKENKLEIYPNPSKGEVFIAVEQELKRIDIFNLFGKKVKQYEGNTTQIKLPEEKGIYFIRIETLNGGISSQKIVKD